MIGSTKAIWKVTASQGCFGGHCEILAGNGGPRVGSLSGMDVRCICGLRLATDSFRGETPNGRLSIRLYRNLAKAAVGAARRGFGAAGPGPRVRGGAGPPPGRPREARVFDGLTLTTYQKQDEQPCDLIARGYSLKTSNSYF